MNKKKLEMFKKKLLEQKQNILNNSTSIAGNDNYHVSQDDLADEADLASSTLNQGVNFQLKEKEQQVLAAIDEALEKIEDGTYGLCETCEEPIEDKRLEIYPTARLCVAHQEEEEQRRKRHFA